MEGLNWWVRWEDDDGEYRDDGPFPTQQDAEHHCRNWHPCVAQLVLNDRDRELSPV